jgi:hypothetical protein
MERRRKPVARKPSRRVAGAANDEQDSVTLPLPHIADLISEGEITIGEMYPVGCVAVATDGHNCLAMLRRRDGETLGQLLTRLDQAIAKALDEDIYTDEINARS